MIAVIIVALVAGGLAGAELYARHRADGVLVEVAECVVRDGVTISYGVNPPFLWQHMTGRYTNISVSTAGNNVQDATGMTADVTVSDVRLRETGDSKGTIGSLTATLTWKSAGIKETLAENLPAVGSLITGVRTDPAAGTIIVDAGDNSVTAKPVVAEGDLNLEVLDVTGSLPKDAVQSALNDLTKKLNDNYPLGIHADSVEVTDSGVVGKFSSQNASIPNEDANPCFAPIGTENVVRSFAYCSDMSRQAWMQPTARAAMATRPSSSVARNCPNPLPRSPSRLASGTRQFTNDSGCVSDACQPSLS